ncbi:MAG: hypothetical protein QNJ75_05320 [Acidimicrobiia bacterium]|nr:hypothetical protein [Acidimicrobiia bacterium]
MNPFIPIQGDKWGQAYQKKLTPGMWEFPSGLIEVSPDLRIRLLQGTLNWTSKGVRPVTPQNSQKPPRLR